MASPFAEFNIKCASAISKKGDGFSELARRGVRDAPVNRKSKVDQQSFAAAPLPLQPWRAPQRILLPPMS
jgi:hypothetical protein